MRRTPSLLPKIYNMKKVMFAVFSLSFFVSSFISAQGQVVVVAPVPHPVIVVAPHPQPVIVVSPRPQPVMVVSEHHHHGRGHAKGHKR